MEETAVIEAAETNFPHFAILFAVLSALVPFKQAYFRQLDSKHARQNSMLYRCTYYSVLLAPSYLSLQLPYHLSQNMTCNHTNFSTYSRQTKNN